MTVRDFPGSPVVKTLPSIARGKGSIPGGGTKIPHDMWHCQKKKKKKIGMIIISMCKVGKEIQ